MKRSVRNGWWMLMMVLALVLPAASQLQIGDNVKLSLNGVLTSGYDGSFSNTGISAHGLGLGGDGDLAGFYYNPNFLSFDVRPYYNRSQSNSDVQSVSNTSGFSSSVNIFSGSRFPGGVGFGKDYNSIGQFGLPGTAGIVTQGDSQSFNIGWSLLLPELPSLSASYSISSGSSAVVGAPGESDSSSRSFSLRSGYRIDGFALQGGFLHNSTNMQTAASLLGGSQAEGTNNSFQFGASHALPWHGSFSAGFTRGSYNYHYQNATSTQPGSNGTSDSVNGNFNFHPVDRLSLSFSTNYNDNVTGALAQQIINQGGAVPAIDFSTSRSLVVSGDVSYTIITNLFAHANITRSELFFAGQTSGATQFSGGINYNYARGFLGMLSFSAGISDTVVKEGNSRVGGYAGVNLSRKIHRFDVSGSFNYSQDVQTLLNVYTTSGYSYGLGLTRKFGDRTSWNGNFGGSRSGLSAKGSSNHAERVGTGLSYKNISGSVYYSEAVGNALFTATGLVAAPTSVPLPLISPDALIIYNGRSYGASASATLLHRMAISGAYSKGYSSTLTPVQQVVTNNEILTGLLRYPFRKMYFNAGFTRLSQSISTAAAPPSVVVSYYFGISRWFNFF